MHQPFYKDPFTDTYRLPWVRLHGTKDYFGMAAILEEYPDIKQTFNIVPSLIEQLIDYTDNNTTDAFLEVTKKKASALEISDKVFLLENFFLANWENMIKPFPRYYELLSKRGLRFIRPDLSRIAEYFTENDFLDLQVLFNLVWIDPVLRSKDPFLTQLEKKGKGFSEEEKLRLIEKQFSILQGIIPRYKELSDKRQIEISTSPYYHPILPLLWDTDIAQVSNPHTMLPGNRFSHPADAGKQVRMALDYFEKIFGHKPSGMWPSEGSVSEDIAKTLYAEGIEWIATDEDILFSSLRENLRAASGSIEQPSRFYTAYNFAGLSMLFRDHRLSDLLGFVYSGWDAKTAAHDFIDRLLQIHSSISDNEPHIVPIILDGENAWEYYKNNGTDFFRYLYEGLSENERLKTTTISGYLKEHSDRKKLARLHPGSWINANFNVWIGHEEDNKAWDYLSETRRDLELYEKANPGKNLDSAWKSIYIAEGSDWNWWYGDDHSTDSAKDFDELFRLNLMNVYKEIGKEASANLFIPIIKEDSPAAPTIEIRGFIHPRIDGLMTNYFEWYHAAQLNVEKSGGSMHLSESLISKVYYGFNNEALFLRVDPKGAFADFPEDAMLTINIIKPSHCIVTIPLKNTGLTRLLISRDGKWIAKKGFKEAAVADILECAIPFRDIDAKGHDELNLFLSVRKGNEEIERCPWRGYITITVPTADFEAIMWS